MKKYINTLIGLFLLLAVSCSNEDTSIENTSREVEFNINTKIPGLNKFRVFIFDVNKTLIQEQSYNSSPVRLKAPVGNFYFVVLGATAGDIFTPEFSVGVSKMSDVMLQITSPNTSEYFTELSELYYYATTVPIVLNQIASLDVTLSRIGGLLSFNVKAKSDMTDIWARIASPVESVDFNLTSKQYAEGKYIRCKLVKDPLDGNFKGNMAAFSQTSARIQYEVVYNQSMSQLYTINEPVDIHNGVKTSIGSEFSTTLNSTINYSTWDASYDIDYVAGFQLKLTVDGGQPINYTGISIKIMNTKTNAITQIDSIPTRLTDGYLMFDNAKFIDDGSYQIIYARLHDRDGMLEDPNGRGSSLNIKFNIPGKIPTLILDGRQNEEEYFVRKVIRTMHGSLPEGSVYPGLITYATRCVPNSLPTEQEGTTQTVWSTPSIAGGEPYFITQNVVSSEWRISGFYFAAILDAFDQSDIIDSRFKAGGGSMPITDFSKLLYTNRIKYSRIDFKYGNDISGFANVKRLQGLMISNYDITDLNKFSGVLPPILSKLDMIYFEVLGTNLTSTLPTEYGGWKNLSKLHIISNPGLTGSMPSSYANFLQATLFRISRTNVSGKVPVSFEVYANMNVGFNLTSNKFSCMPDNFIKRYTTNVTLQSTGTIGACP